MKKCFKCGEDKCFSQFYKHPKMGDGLLGKCKECTKKDSNDRFKEKLLDPQWAINERKRQREKEERRRNDGKVKKSIALKKCCQKPANRILSYAIKSGKVIPLPCEVCEKIKSQGHHENYSMPLDVVWLCTRHHNDRHIHLRDSKTLRQTPIPISEWIEKMKQNRSL